MRLFIAAWLPHDVSAALSRLARPGIDGLRWTRPEQHHVTLAFLGEIADEQAKSLAAALRAWAPGASAATATAGPSTRRLGRGVLCVPVRGFDVLAAGVRTVAAEFAAVRDDRPYMGHLTVARAHRRIQIPAELVGVPMTADWEVREVRLVASTLTPAGAHYEAIALFRLAG